VVQLRETTGRRTEGGAVGLAVAGQAEVTEDQIHVGTTDREDGGGPENGRVEQIRRGR